MRDSRGTLVCLERREVSVGAAVKTDDGKVESIILSKNLAIALCRGPHGQSRRAHGKCIEKLASRNHHFLLESAFYSEAAILDLSRSQVVSDPAGNSSFCERFLQSVHVNTCGPMGRAFAAPSLIKTTIMRRAPTICRGAPTVLSRDLK